MVELGRWGARFMDQPRRGDTTNLGWGLLSLKRRYRGGVRAVVEFRVGVTGGSSWRSRTRTCT